MIGRAAAAYLALTLVMTWPLVRGLARDVPYDLGDPLLNIWILAWNLEQFTAIARGDLARAARFFDANIFHPAPLTLAYSEHLAAQALQVFPVYLATGNPILCYNLLFLSTFVLSALGAFLLVRELTGNARAAFVAGLFYGFALYRWSQGSHLQVLSSQWMPFALYGFRRYFVTGRRRALAGAAAAVTLQNLSCGYFLLYFAPVAAGYVVWELTTRRLWRSYRQLGEIGAAAAAVILVTLPFLLPYQAVRESLQFTRDFNEIVRYSADVYSYLTAYAGGAIWGDVLRAFPKPEGDLFPGLVVPALALGAAAALMFDARRVSAEAPSRAPRWVLVATAAAGAAYAALAIVLLFARRVDVDLGLFTLRATDVTRLMAPPAAATALIAVLSPTARARIRHALARPEAMFLIIALGAWWLSLGPAPRALGRPLDLWSPYRFLYDVVPGFDGLRAPARLAMIGTLALSVLAGMTLARLRGTVATPALVLASAMFLLESQVVPIPINATAAVRGFTAPESRVYRPERAPEIYQAVAQTPADAVLLEMPFGAPDYDVRAVFYTTAHWRRLVNGYSGYFPPSYSLATAVLNGATRPGSLAGSLLDDLGVTHVIVHENAYLDDEGRRFSAWLRDRGAVEVARSGGDVLFALPR